MKNNNKYFGKETGYDKETNRGTWRESSYQEQVRIKGRQVSLDFRSHSVRG